MMPPLLVSPKSKGSLPERVGDPEGITASGLPFAWPLFSAVSKISPIESFAESVRGESDTLLSLPVL